VRFEDGAGMISAAIFFISILSLLMFFIIYCRSLTASVTLHAISRETQDVAGISAVASAPDFRRLTNLLRLCARGSETQSSLRAVGQYYRILSVVERLVAHLSPSLASLAEQERARCAHYAALILDRQIAVVLKALGEQTGS
jgi:hypothetical protein